MSPARFLIVFVVLAGLARAQGGPPMITDDPGTPGSGHWEINVAVTRERRAGERLTEMPLIDVNFGIGDRLQLKYEAAWVRVSDGSGSHAGLSNSLVGVKWRFFDAGVHGWSASVYPQLELNNPGSHSDERGLAAHGTGLILPVQVMKDFGIVGLNADLGFVAHPDGDEWFGGVALGREFSHGIEAAVELHTEADGHFSGRIWVLNAGLRFGLSPKCTLLISLGREISNPHEARATLIAYLGMQTCF